MHVLHSSRKELKSSSTSKFMVDYEFRESLLCFSDTGVTEVFKVLLNRLPLLLILCHSVILFPNSVTR